MLAGKGINVAAHVPVEDNEENDYCKRLFQAACKLGELLDAGHHVFI